MYNNSKWIAVTETLFSIPESVTTLEKASAPKLASKRKGEDSSAEGKIGSNCMKP